MNLLPQFGLFLIIISFRVSLSMPPRFKKEKVQKEKKVQRRGQGEVYLFINNWAEQFIDQSLNLN